MARRSVQLNDLENQVQMIQGDLAQADTWIKRDSADVVTCNPPYFPLQEKSAKNPNEHLAIARHELFTNLEEVTKMMSALLKTNGKAFLVHRPDRFLEILDTMRRHRLAPKKIRFIYPKKSKEANVLLVEAIKDGKETGLRILPPLVVYTEENIYTPEVRRIVYGDE